MGIFLLSELRETLLERKRELSKNGAKLVIFLETTKFFQEKSYLSN